MLYLKLLTGEKTLDFRTKLFWKFFMELESRLSECKTYKWKDIDLI